MSENIDIIIIDKQIKKSFADKIKNTYTNSNNHTNSTNNSNNYIDLTEYIYLTENLINEYTNIINDSINFSFFDNNKLNENNKLKNIINDYLYICKKYIDISNINCKKNQIINTDNKCSCGSNKFINKDNSIFCNECSIEQQVQNVQNSFKDIDRINISQKYKYKKKVHFKDTINQYQGKQNKKNNDNLLYEILEKEFEKMSLLVHTKNNKLTSFHEKHINITKDIIYMILNETGNNKKYEDINLIHNYFTGIPCPDISHLETELYNDFDRVVETYDNMNIERKNFLNSKYVLYQLLRLHNYKVDIRDFDILKTRERLIEHDTIWKNICKELKWNFKPCV
jgi:hypothetical protein